MGKHKHQHQQASQSADSSDDSSDVNDVDMMPPVRQSTSNKRRAVDESPTSLPKQKRKMKAGSHQDDFSVTSVRDQTTDAVAELHVILAQQRTELRDLRETVRQQQHQIDFLLSALGISTGGSATGSDTSPPTTAVVGNDGGTTSSSQSSRTYADMVRKPSSISTLPPVMKQAVVSAVYSDMKDRDRRSRNIVVSGIPITVPVDDPSAAVSAVIEREFHSKPDIVRCRRLGKLQQGRIQPILVSLQTDEQASYFVQNAKSLRHSEDDYTRKSIFINRDITKAEARAAYDERCERRRRLAARGQSSSSAVIPVSSQSTTVQLQPAITIAAHNATNLSSLDATAVPYIPNNE
jgi:hypothetical protein